jgi:hypothetical protein
MLLGPTVLLRVVTAKEGTGGKGEGGQESYRGRGGWGGRRTLGERSAASAQRWRTGAGIRPSPQPPPSPPGVSSPWTGG